MITGNAETYNPPNNPKITINFLTFICELLKVKNIPITKINNNTRR